jgi:two-component system chemotaxis response regulator CheY
MKKSAAIQWKKDGQPLRCMIVDDSIYARKNLRYLVETFGGQVAGEAADGLTAITEYHRIKPDVVLMDVVMPKMGGIDAAEVIVQQNPQARIVMVSSAGSRVDILAALRCGARQFVHKPVKPEALTRAIQRVLEEHGILVPAAAALAAAHRSDESA